MSMRPLLQRILELETGISLARESAADTWDLNLTEDFILELCIAAKQGLETTSPASAAPAEVLQIGVQPIAPFCGTCGKQHYAGTALCTGPAEASEPTRAAKPFKMNDDPEWPRKKAQQEAECDSVAVGDPSTVICAWCGGELLNRNTAVTESQPRTRNDHTKRYS